MNDDNELKSRLVFIDTCIFIGKHFNFGINALGRTQQYLKENKIFLLMPDITKYEIENKIMITAQDAHSKLKYLFKKENSIKMLAVADDLPYSGTPQVPTAEEIYKKIHSKFIEFIELDNVELISTESVNIKTVFDNYFNSNPPFGKGGKKYEFPDAFVLEAIQGISQSRKTDLYVISSDPDLKSYTELHNNLYHLPDINNLFDLINHNDKELEQPALFADNVFRLMEDQIIAKGKEHFEFAEYMASDISDNIFEDVIDLVTVHGVEIAGKNLLSVSETSAEFEIIFRVGLTVNFSVPDHENVIYDRETGTIYNLEYNRFSENYKKEYSANLTIEYEDRIKRHAQIEEFTFEDDVFDVN